EIMDAMRRGRLDVEVPERASRDELGDMGRAVDVFRRGLIEKRRADEALEREHGMLLEREAELQTQNVRFTAAMTNMVQGLCMFDRDQKLVMSNKRFAEMYDLPADRVRPGTALADLLAGRSDREDGALLSELLYAGRRAPMEVDRNDVESF